jgi:hypothetical protein
MQIGHSTQLSILKSVSQPLAANSANGQAGDATEVGTSAAKSALNAGVSQLMAVDDGPGVILKLQSDGSTTTGLVKPQDMVYSNASKVQASQDSDADQMAAQHQLALERSKAAPTRLSVDKNGLLVANAGVDQTTGEADSPPKDFVTFAVKAMRDYAANQDRLKAIAEQSSHVSATALLARGLGDVQKLAAKYKLFA